MWITDEVFGEAKPLRLTAARSNELSRVTVGVAGVIWSTCICWVCREQIATITELRPLYDLFAPEGSVPYTLVDLFKP